MEKRTFGKEVNLNKDYIYNVEKILLECESKYDNKNTFIDYLSKLLNEKQKDLLMRLYSIADKKFILSILEKTLNAINEGGIEKKNTINTEPTQNVRSVSGTFLYLIKKSEVLSKKDIKRIFWRNNAKKKEKKKFNKQFDKLNI